MFTGLIEGQGRILSVEPSHGQARISIASGFEWPDPAVGESVSVNGVCLSVEAFFSGSFAAYASAETLGRTTLGALRSGQHVNLERAVRLGSRMGGHIVTGHVDAVGTVRRVEQAGESMRCTIGFDRALAPFVVRKGSVALDGISLTINDCGLDYLTVNVIPETSRVTTASQWRTGTKVNMETDIMGRYIMRQKELEAFMAETGSGSGIDEDFLRENGFM